MKKKRFFVSFLAVVLFLAGCALFFNRVPLARFTADPLTGFSPLAVHFDASGSSDPDGIIAKYEWDFGDGSTGRGQTIDYTFTPTATTTFTVALTVTDDDGKADTVQEMIVVSESEEPPPGPYATFTATPQTGEAPLTVTFDATGSYHPNPSCTITSYTWDFGDGATGTGVTTTHTYYPPAEICHVVLMIIGSDNTQATADDYVSVLAPPGPPPPCAYFTADKTSGVGPFVCNFDPANSAAHQIQTYFWTFEINDATILDTTGAVVQQTFYTSLPTRNYTVTLVVIDNQGLTCSFSRAIQVKNLQPVAGFEVEDATNNGGTWTVPTTTTPLDITGVGALPGRNTTVTIRSQNPGYPFVVPPPNENENIKPGNFETAPYTAGDRNLSYDPEGYGIPGDGWGIKEYRIDWGDGSSPVTVADDGAGGLAATAHVYTLPAGNTSATFDIVITVVDESDGVGSLTRRIVLHET